MGADVSVRKRVLFRIEQIELWVFGVSTRSFINEPVYDRPLANYLEMKFAMYLIKDCCVLLDELKDNPEEAESYTALKESYDVLREFIYGNLKSKQDSIEENVNQLKAVDSYSMWSFPLR